MIEIAMTDFPVWIMWLAIANMVVAILNATGLFWESSRVVNNISTCIAVPALIIGVFWLMVAEIR